MAFLLQNIINIYRHIYNKVVLFSFDDNKYQLFVLKIPLEYLLNPFEVYFTEDDDTNLDQIDKIIYINLKHRQDREKGLLETLNQRYKFQMCGGM